MGPWHADGAGAAHWSCASTAPSRHTARSSRAYRRGFQLVVAAATEYYSFFAIGLVWHKLHAFLTKWADVGLRDMMTRDVDFRADLARYRSHPFFREQSIWAIWVYRLGRRIYKRKPGVMRSIQLKFYAPLFRFVETITGISLPIEAQIGPGLRIYHFGNIFVHPQAVIGRNCTLRQGVTIGNVGVESPVPVVEDDVEFGAYAQVLGNIRIGCGAKIGAMSVVLSDVPAGAAAFGNPARILRGSDKPQPV